MDGRPVVPAIKAKTKAKRPQAVPEREDHRAFVAAIGRLVRLARAKRGMTRRQLAQASGASERYLAQIEGGEGNPSVIMLASIAQALDVPIIELLPRSNGRTAAMAQILDILARTPRGAAFDQLGERGVRRSTVAGGSRWSDCAAPANRRWVAGSRMRSVAPSSSSIAWSNRTTARAFPI